jgi:hypothetical protein
MKKSNESKGYQALEELHNKDRERSVAKNDCYVTRYIYEGNSGTQEGPLTIVDDQHNSQRRRYFNSRRGV